MFEVVEEVDGQASEEDKKEIVLMIYNLLKDDKNDII